LSANNAVWSTSSFGQLSKREMYDLLRLRQDIFVVEQQCAYPELDGLDEGAFHMRCFEDGKLLAYQRLLPPGLSYPESSIGRILVTPEGRGRQLGRELVERGIIYNRNHWPDSNMRIGAQAHLRDFYASLGFTVDGEEYVEDGISHVQMVYLVVSNESENAQLNQA
jgi:ElaA protein